jgi:hypothetical protein
MKTIILIILINISHSKGLGGSIGDVDIKKGHFIIFY